MKEATFGDFTIRILEKGDQHHTPEDAPASRIKENEEYLEFYHADGFKYINVFALDWFCRDLNYKAMNDILLGFSDSSPRLPAKLWNTEIIPWLLEYDKTSPARRKKRAKRLIKELHDFLETNNIKIIMKPEAEGSEVFKCGIKFESDEFEVSNTMKETFPNGSTAAVFEYSKDLYDIAKVKIKNGS